MIPLMFGLVLPTAVMFDPPVTIKLPLTIMFPIIVALARIPNDVVLAAFDPVLEAVHETAGRNPEVTTLPVISCTFPTELYVVVELAAPATIKDM